MLWICNLFFIIFYNLIIIILVNSCFYCFGAVVNVTQPSQVYRSSSCIDLFRLCLCVCWLYESTHFGLVWWFCIGIQLNHEHIQWYLSSSMEEFEIKITSPVGVVDGDWYTMLVQRNSCHRTNRNHIRFNRQANHFSHVTNRLCGKYPR